MDIELKNLELLGKDPSDLVFFKHKQKNQYLTSQLAKLNEMLQRI